MLDSETDELDRTEVFRGSDDVGPDELLGWLATVVGPDVAQRPHRLAAPSIASLSATSSR